jgi:hypothetical protein
VRSGGTVDHHDLAAHVLALVVGVAATAQIDDVALGVAHAGVGERGAGHGAGARRRLAHGDRVHRVDRHVERLDAGLEAGGAHALLDDLGEARVAVVAGPLGSQQRAGSEIAGYLRARCRARPPVMAMRGEAERRADGQRADPRTAPGARHGGRC